MCIALKALDKIQHQIDSVQLAQENLIEQLTYYDRKLAALYHSIENEPQLGTVNGYKVYRELKKLLTERRKIKGEYYAITSFLDRFTGTKQAVARTWENQNLESYDQYTSVKEILSGSYQLNSATIPGLD